MSILDRAKDVAAKAVDAGKQGAERAREKGQAMSLRRRFNALAEELGQIVFRQRDGEPTLDAEVDRLVAEMREVRAELDALQD